ncbi:MAG: type IV pilin protein [Gammaproteobacteria bacterium]
MNRQHGQGGFTLIELMIVVAIIGFLAAIAYPSYNAYVTKSMRSVGQSILTQVASRQEQFFLDNKTYADNLTLLGYAANPMTVSSDGQPNGGGQVVYQVVIDESTTANTFLLRAVPQGTHATRDTDCATLSLNHRGQKAATGTAPAKCW